MNRYSKSRVAPCVVISSFLAFGILTLGMLTLGSGPAEASDAALTSKIKIFYLGVNVGVLKQHITVTGDQYTITGGAKANSVVAVVSDAKANFSSTGQIEGYRLVPAEQKLTYKAGKKRGHLYVDYGESGVVKIEASPEIKYKPGTVPLEKAHLQQVVDPVSSILFPVKTSDIGNGRKVCNRVLPVFDGRTRMNLVFEYKSSKTMRAKGFSGKTHTCRVRYQPVSGIRPFRKNIKFMKANRDMEVTMARVGSSDVYAIYGFRVKTSKGLVTGSAYHFSTK